MTSRPIAERSIADFRRNAPWFFALLPLPYSFSIAAAGSVLPFLLRAHGVGVDRIAEIMAVAMLPNVWGFVLAPVIDLGLRRRAWVWIGNVAFGLCAAGALLLMDRSIAWMTAALFLGFAVNNFSSSALGALMAELPGTIHGRVSGWFQAGNVGIGAAVSGVAIWAASQYSVGALSIGAVLLIGLTVLVVFFVREPERVGSAPGPLFSAVWGELKQLARERDAQLGVLFLASPICAFAASGLAVTLGPDFSADAAEVAWVTGIGSAICSVVGSLAGGFVCDRIDRRTAYGLCGVFAGAAATYVAFAVPTPVSYAVGFLTYALANGFGYAAFTSLLLDLSARRKAGVATAYAILGASASVAVTYMTLLDGLGYKWAGVRGLMVADGGANVLSAAALLWLAKKLATQRVRMVTDGKGRLG